jgi:hypothetical protein
LSDVVVSNASHVLGDEVCTGGFGDDRSFSLIGCFIDKFVPSHSRMILKPNCGLSPGNRILRPTVNIGSIRSWTWDIDQLVIRLVPGLRNNRVFAVLLDIGVAIVLNKSTSTSAGPGASSFTKISRFVLPIVYYWLR